MTKPIKTIQVKHPVQGMTVAHVTGIGQEGNQPVMFLNFGTFTCRMIGEFPHTEVDFEDPAISALFGKVRQAAQYDVLPPPQMRVKPVVRNEPKSYIDDTTGLETTIYNDCLCGCGGKSKGTFLAGHDAKLKSLLNKVVAGELSKDSIPVGVADYINRKNTAESWRTKYGSLFL